MKAKGLETYAADEHFKKHNAKGPVVRRVCIGKIGDYLGGHVIQGSTKGKKTLF